MHYGGNNTNGKLSTAKHPNRLSDDGNNEEHKVTEAFDEPENQTRLG